MIYMMLSDGEWWPDIYSPSMFHSLEDAEDTARKCAGAGQRIQLFKLVEIANYKPKGEVTNADAG